MAGSSTDVAMTEAVAGSSDREVLGFSPSALTDEVINVVNDYILQIANEMESTLVEHPELANHAQEVKDGVDLWESKMRRAADGNFGTFELYALKNVFAVPDNLQLAPPGATMTEEETQLDAETEALWTQLQQALATKRELQRKLTAAHATTSLWATHRESVQQLAESQKASNVENTLQGVQQLGRTLHEGWQLLRSSEGADGGRRGPMVPGPRGALQRYSQRRTQISTAGVPDLQQLSSLLTQAS